MDASGNGKLTLSEVNSGTLNALRLQELFDAKPVIKLSFKQAKLKVDRPGSRDDDYICEMEFRFLLKFLAQYFEYWSIFHKLDTDHDRRVSFAEFKAGKKVLQEWGIDMKDPEARWKECDDNDSGNIMFDEFCAWADKKGFNLPEAKWDFKIKLK